MNTKKLLTILLCLTLIFSLFGCNKKSPQQEADQSKADIKIEKLLNGETIDVMSEVVSEYLSKQSEKEQISFLYENSVGLPTYGNEFHIEWSYDQGASYTVHFSLKEDFSNEITVKTDIPYIENCSMLEYGKLYYYKITKDNSQSSSIVDSFIIKDTDLHMIELENCHNIRDIGGWKAGNKKVNHGKIFRGGRVEMVDELGKSIMHDFIGLKSEIDLRGEHDDHGQKASAFGEDVKYIKVDMKSYSMIIPQYVPIRDSLPHYDEGTPEKIKAVFTILGNKDNYPVYIHCNQGADRTGTMALLINGLLGVSYDDLVRDFELTTFSEYRIRCRGKGNRDGELLSDVMNAEDDYYVAFNELYKLLIKHYGKGSSEFSVAVENYLKEVCSVTDDEIATVKSVMLS